MSTPLEAEKNKYRCPDCHTPLEESRGTYYCPACMLANIKGEKSYYTIGREDAANAIAAMEYKGESK